MRLEIQRLGAETESILKQDNLNIVSHPIPDRASSQGCNWPATHSVKIPKNWNSGCYIATLSLQAGKQILQEQVTFVVRAISPGKSSPILLQLSTNTWNAYTNWGGHSLYAYHDRDGLQGHRVSFDRPISSQYSKWEHPFVQWAESSGYPWSMPSIVTWSFILRYCSTTS